VLRPHALRIPRWVKTRIPLQRPHVSFHRLRTLIRPEWVIGPSSHCACLGSVQLPLRVSAVSQDFDWYAIAPQYGILIIGRLVGRSARRVRSSRSLRAQGRAASYQAATRGSGAAAGRDVTTSSGRMGLEDRWPLDLVASVLKGDAPLPPYRRLSGS
jgi:hypothetical protein